MSTKIKFEKDVDNAPAVSAEVDHGAVNTEKEDNINLGLVQQSSDVAEEMKLDDARRVKAVSPGMLVAKRFFRNKLAMVGLGILIALFLFCFVGSAIYPYSEKDVFMTTKILQFDYAFAKVNKEYSNFFTDKTRPSSTFVNMINSNIATMKSEEVSEKVFTDSETGKKYRIIQKNNDVYTVEFDDTNAMATFIEREVVGTYKATKQGFDDLTLYQPDDALKSAIMADFAAHANKASDVSVSYGPGTYTLVNNKVILTYPSLTEVTTLRDGSITDDMITTALANLDGSFIAGGKTYTVDKYGYGGKNDTNAGYYVNTGIRYLVFASTTMQLDRFVTSMSLSNEFILATMLALGDYDAADPTTSTYVYDAKTYTISTDEEGELNIKEGTTDILAPSHYSVRRYTGEDTISLGTKKAFREVMDYMMANGLTSYEKVIRMEAIDENGDVIYDENNNVTYAEEKFYVKSQDKGSGQQFVFRNDQSKTVADIHADPSKEHILGLDGNAMDVLARVMYGGRVSLMIGFIVVFIEIILGSILGGISGYFGGVVDNIIMRIVDVFYCIPTLPILIILGAMFDKIGMPNLERIIWMMAVLGFLGWPGIARLVRGQILSLREQDFMIAAEASGLKSSRKIAKHLIPNVIPQLIVQATMGLGGVIITESTLSFLGLGVKFPMATWGQIINSVSSINDMVKYTYIWIPVGALICLAVIAFNFVGDGLRDAFDPKMNR